MACDKCGGTGKIPLKNYKYGFYYCDCREEPREQFQALMPADFDFPMSDLFRGASFDYCGVKDPGRQVEHPVASNEQVIVHRHSNMNKQESDLLQNTARELQHIKTTLATHIGWKKQVAKAVIERKGLKIE